MKILCTGDKSHGLCKALSETDLDIDFVCEKDHLFNEGSFLRLIEQESLKHDIFINCAKLSNFLQVQVLYNIYYLWLQMKKAGQIITIGSDIIYHPRPILYCLEKQALKSLHDMLYEKQSGIKMTLIHPGKLGEGHIPYSDVVAAITQSMISPIREITVS